MNNSLQGLSDIPRPNWVEIDLDALSHNIQHIRSISSQNGYLLPVKADAYGHGILVCSLAAQKNNVDYLGVAHLFEGIGLRQEGIQIPILVLGPAHSEDFPHIVSHSLTPTFVDFETLKAFDQFLGNFSLPQTYPVHLKLNTGMNRYGMTYQADFSPLQSLKNCEIEGVFSHLACAEAPENGYNQLQLERFEKAVTAIHNLDITPRWIHLSNSAGVFDIKSDLVNMIRPGIASYGCSPIPQKTFFDLGLKQVLSLKASIRQVQTLEAGEATSYGQKWTAPQKSTLAAIAIGYGDGFHRNPSEKLRVGIEGQLFPIVGTVCMDTSMVDISGFEYKKQQVVDVLNGNLDTALSIETMAECYNTIPYEITCGLARRLYRVYKWKSRQWRWDELQIKLKSRSS